MDKEKTRRVFFALWPDDDVRKKIVETFDQSPQAKLKARIMRPENLHLTLHFIGNVSEKKLTCLDQAAQTVKVGSFELALSRYGHFDKAKIFWMGCQSTPDELKVLHHHLGDALAACDYQADNRPYAPHVTLMRKLKQPGVLEVFNSINWLVNNFVLVESVPACEGVKYKVIKRYNSGS